MLSISNVKFVPPKEAKIDVVIEKEDISEIKYLEDKIKKYFDSKTCGSILYVTEFQRKYWLGRLIFKRNNQETDTIVLLPDEITVFGKIIVRSK